MEDCLVQGFKVYFMFVLFSFGLGGDKVAFDGLSPAMERVLEMDIREGYHQ